ncbi:MBOAT, membrane-bound O-acyltransferase family-domain-containing protein [Obelidium mucronatum]|nr:MBOAT, membrane-bound O-acyltransferase family-domain-containing protein [Obelidium mucronatum]
MASLPPHLLMPIFVLTCGYYFIPLFCLIPSNAHSLRHAFSILASSILYISLFQLGDFLEILAMISVVYIVTLTFRNKPWMPVLVFVYAMTHFCYRLFILQVVSLVHEEHIDPATPMMIMVIRLTSFAWSVYDGSLESEQVIPVLLPKVVTEFPTLLEFLGFAMFFVTFITGPALDFNDYRDFIRRQGAFSSIPSRSLPTLKVVVAGVFFSGVYIVLMDKFTYGFCATPEFLREYTFWQRIAYMQIAGFTARTKYYAVFKLSEGACNLIGIGYTGGGNTWTRAQGVIITSVEFAENFKQLFAAWNMKTALWLRNCVYLRMVKPGQKPGALVTWTTFMVSALWHGFHPGYYLTFGMGGAFPVLARSARKYLRPLFLKPSKLARLKAGYDFLGWLFTWLSLNCIVAPFVVWYLPESLAAWSAVGYYSIILWMVGYSFLELLGGGRWIQKTVWKWAAIEKHRTVTVTKEKLK